MTRARLGTAQEQALHDHLTGLPNRVLFLERANHALVAARAQRTGVAVLFLDLDRFKTINDSLGHEAGDQLLRATADRLAEVIRPTDTLARLAGDEFAILCEQVETKNDAVGVAKRLLACMEVPVVLGHVETVVSASVGVTLSGGVSGVRAAALLGQADAAMYLAKERGRGRVEVFGE